jgi:hypothetical protein
MPLINNWHYGSVKFPPGDYHDFVCAAERVSVQTSVIDLLKRRAPVSSKRDAKNPCGGNYCGPIRRAYM